MTEPLILCKWITVSSSATDIPDFPYYFCVDTNNHMDRMHNSNKGNDEKDNYTSYASCIFKFM